MSHALLDVATGTMFRVTMNHQGVLQQRDGDFGKARINTSRSSLCCPSPFRVIPQLLAELCQCTTQLAGEVLITGTPVDLATSFDKPQSRLRHHLFFNGNDQENHHVYLSTSQRHKNPRA